MKTSKFFLSTLIAAAAMTANAYAATTDATASDQTITVAPGTSTSNDLKIAEGYKLGIGTGGAVAEKKDVTFSNSTITISKTEGATDFAWLGATSGNSPQNTNYTFSNVTLVGSGDFGITTRINNNNKVNTVQYDGAIDLTGLVGGGESFTGRLMVYNQWSRAMEVSVSGTALANAEYVFGSCVEAGDISTSVKNETDGTAPYNLILKGVTSLAGITGSTTKTDKESVTVSTAGTMLTLAGGDSAYNGYSNSGAFVYNGTFGTSAAAIGLSVTGGNQTLGGTNYIDALSVSGGALTLSGTTSIADAVTVSGGALTLGGNVTLNETIDVSSGSLTFDDGVSLILSGDILSSVDAPVDKDGYASASARIYTGSATNGGSFSLNVNGSDETVNNGVVLFEDKTTYYANTENARYSDIDSNTALTKVVVGTNGVFTVDSGTLSLAKVTIEGAGATKVVADGTIDLGNVTTAKTDFTKFTGDGTLRVHGADSNHNGGVKLSNEFTGSVVMTGRFNIPRDTILGGATTVKLGTETDRVYLWTAETATFNQAFEVYGAHTPGQDGELRNQQRGWGNITYTGSFTLTEGASFGFEQGTTTFAGTLTGKSGSTLYVNGATVNIGKVKTVDGAEVVEGTATLDSLNVSGGSVNLRGTSTISGSVTVSGGSVNLRGTSTISGSVTVSGGSVNIANLALPSTTFEAGSKIVVSGGSVTFGEDRQTMESVSFGENLTLEVSGTGTAKLSLAEGANKTFAGNIVLKNGATLNKWDGGVVITGDVTLGESESDVMSILSTWQKAEGIEISGKLSGKGTTYVANDEGNKTEKFTISGSDNSYSGSLVIGKKNADADSSGNVALYLTSAGAAKDASITLGGKGSLHVGTAATTLNKAVTMNSGSTLNIVGDQTVTLNSVAKGDATGGQLILNASSVSLALSGELDLDRFTVAETLPTSIDIDFGISGSITSSTNLNFGNDANRKFTFTVSLSDTERATLVAGTDVTRTLLETTGNNANQHGIWNLGNNDTNTAFSPLTFILNNLEGLGGYSLISDTIVNEKDLHKIGEGMYGLVFHEGGGSDSLYLFVNAAIPEPSAFGLLAGVGALALVASRRRRNRR